MNKTLATALLAISPMTFAGTLTIPQEFEFVAINGTSVESSMFSHNDEEDLKDGVNKVAIQYKDLVKDNIGDGHSKIKSAPFVVTFDADSRRDYKLKTTVSIADQDDAEAFAADPKVIIVDDKGSKVKFTMVLSQQKERGLFNQIIGHYPAAEEEAIVATGGVVAQAPAAPATPMATATAPAVAAAPAVVVAPAPAVANQPHSMMEYWWTEADSATRSAFTGWAVQHLVSTETPKASNGSNQAENMLRYWFLKADESTRKTFMSWAIQNL